ncbi:DUF4097 family beta strand repeat-containing protein [Streptomyces bauhiniae]|uniref:DUF4097 family beta strand repeat-containing protein n=1 Tax=Streptomyces bauhiniae TaxID=2340725 RepID=UPI00364EAB1C
MSGPVTVAPPRGHRWIVAGGLAVLAVSVMAASFGLLFMLSADRGYSRSLRADAADSTRLKVEAGRAGVTLSPGTDSLVHVYASGDYEQAAPKVAVASSGGTVTVKSSCQEGCALRLRITVPANLAADVTSSSGEISTSGLGGPLSLRSDSGQIIVSGSAGPLVLRGGSGTVAVTDSRSRHVTVTGGQGSVRAEFAAPPTSVEVSTGDGSVDLEMPQDADYSVEAHSGGPTAPRISLPVERSSRHAVTVRTGNGAIQIH